MSKKIKNDTLFDQVKDLLVTQNWDRLKDVMNLLHIPTIIDILGQASKEERATLIKLLPKSHAARVFRRLDATQKKALLRALPEEEVEALLQSLRPDERVNLFEQMPPNISKRLLQMLQPEDLAEATKLLSYPKSSVGRLMTPDFVAVKENWDIQAVLDHMKRRAKESETINVVYVVDDNWNLLGLVELNKIILAEPHDKIKNIIDRNVVTLSAHDDQEKAVKLLNNYRLSVIPVIDDSSLVGIVTFDDVIDVSRLEATEDIQKSSAIVPLEVSYKNSTIFGLFQKRVGWLLALVLVSLASAGVIAAFEETLSSAIALAFFIPLLIGSGGNAGAQAATLMIRAISLGEVTAKDWIKMSGKEMLVGSTLAIALGAFSSLMGLFKGGVEIGLVVGLSMAAIIIITNLLGTLLPFVLTKLKIDPAVASGPLVTSVADIIGLSVYFTIANVILSQAA